MGQALEDKTIDKLLKVQVRRDGVARTCAEFDPDLASAYLERNLNAVERGRYEHHLIDCHTCRGMVSRLALLDEAAFSAPYSQLATATSAARTTSDSPGLGSLRRFLAALSTPQWALAAVAVIIVAISIPVLFLRTKGFNRMNARSADVAPKGPARSQAPFADGVDASSASQASVATEQRSAGKDEDKNASGKSRVDAAGSDGSIASNPAPASSGQGATPEDRKAAETPAEPPVTNSLALAKSSDAPQEAKDREASAGAAGSNGPSGAPADADKKADKASAAEASSGSNDQNQSADLPKLDPKKALHLPDDSGSASVSVLRHGQVSDQPQPSKEKVATIKPDDSVAPAPEARAGEGTERGRRSIGKQPVTGFVSGTGATAPADDAHWDHGAPSTQTKLAKGERRVESKRFRLIGGVWTDKEFKSDKELPSITLVRGSDVYNALLAKESSLKAYFGGFGAAERAIIVYKKIVYRLLPAETKD